MNLKPKRTFTILVLCIALSMFSMTAIADEFDCGCVGDATADTALLTIIGAVEKPGYFSQDGLRAYTDLIQTKTYNRRDHHGSEDVQTVTGIYLEDLLNVIMTLSPDAASITLTAGDGMKGDYYLDDDWLGVYSTDIDGNKMMLYFDGARLRLAVGRADADHNNRGIWMQNVVRIFVNVDSVGDATEETALLRITGAVEKPGFFSQGGLRAYTEFVQTKTYNRRDHHGSEDVQTVTGIYLEDLLNEIMTISPYAVSVTLTARDNMTDTYNLDDGWLGVYSTDIDSNKMMLYFDGVRLRLAVGRADADHNNRGIWMQDVVSIVVNAVFPVDVIPSAFVTKLNGNQNELNITVTELYPDDTIKTITTTTKINNNAAGVYDVGYYKVYVDTKGNVQIREIYIVE